MCVSVSYFLTCSHRRRPEEYDLHGRKRPRADGPPDFNQRTGLLRAFPVLFLFCFFVFLSLSLDENAQC